MALSSSKMQPASGPIPAAVDLPPSLGRLPKQPVRVGAGLEEPPANIPDGQRETLALLRTPIASYPSRKNPNYPHPLSHRTLRDSHLTALVYGSYRTAVF
ncbi:hypothetical protein ColTof4_07701 [Colletotrichum tofieldiae]|nr:hypothetical protein ColTof3_02770 [Colletotrichum tofieldiae]GKT75278.1 hypothetical protein ColTof4_07701 [Colletotrichum tofieldiae]